MNELSQLLKSQMFAQESENPFLLLVTLSHASFDTIRLVQNTENIVSRGETFEAFPLKITLSPDDGETLREAAIEFDNVSLELINEVRSVTTPIDVKVEMILASNPDEVQVAYEELKMRSLTYNKQTVQGRLFMDSFMNVSLTSEKYGPTNYRGLF